MSAPAKPAVDAMCAANVLPTGTCGNSRAAHGTEVGQIYSHLFIPRVEPAATVVPREAALGHGFVGENGPRWHRFAFGPRESCAECGRSFQAHHPSQEASPPTPDSSDDAAARTIVEVCRRARDCDFSSKQRELTTETALAGIVEGRRLEREACEARLEQALSLLAHRLSADPFHADTKHCPCEGCAFLADAIARRGRS